jgi:hypothetical protein
MYRLGIETKEERKMAQMQGRAMAIAAEERTICCVGANGKSANRSSAGGLSWYFAQRSMPGLVYVATMNGYVASGSYKTKGGKENV